MAETLLARQHEASLAVAETQAQDRTDAAAAEASLSGQLQEQAQLRYEAEQQLQVVQQKYAQRLTMAFMFICYI